jgi:hypothetical protein
LKRSDALIKTNARTRDEVGGLEDAVYARFAQEKPALIGEVARELPCGKLRLFRGRIDHVRPDLLRELVPPRTRRRLLVVQSIEADLPPKFVHS